jgi:cytochrome bd-type quinol oxidase subunit 2
MRGQVFPNECCSMVVFKLMMMCCRGIATLVRAGCLLFIFGYLLQGVAQLEGEALAKRSETSGELRQRMQIVFALFLIGICSSLVYHTIGVFSKDKRGDLKSRMRRAAFEFSVFWGVACLFYCCLILAGSVQARWSVPPIYYWLAAGAGLMTLVLLGSANLFADRNQIERPEQAGKQASGST